MLDKIIEIVAQIPVNKKNGEHSVYKPLLLLIIFNNILKGAKNEFRFIDIEDQLQQLMEKYGWATNGRKKAEYPFYFLASSDLWKINIVREELKHPEAPTKKELTDAVGRLDQKVYEYLIKSPESTKKLIKIIQDKFFTDIVELDI